MQNAGRGIRHLMLLFVTGMAVSHGVLAEVDSEARRQIQSANTLMEQGQLEKAETVLNNVVQQQPQALAAYNNLAIIYARQGRYEAARDILKKGLLVNDEVAALYENLETVYVELSRQEYGKALRIDVKERELALKPIDYTNVQAQPVIAENTTSQSTVTAPLMPTTDSNPLVIDEVNTVILGWASAWAAQQVDLYLSFYAREFIPPNGMKREEWEQQRRTRLTSPKWLEVSISEMNVELAQDGVAKARFLQTYRSENYSDNTRKELALSQTTDGWKIISENSY